MVDIVNITRTYTFADGIPLVNSQLESELSNIVDKINKDLSYITANVYFSTGLSEAEAINPSGTSNWNDIATLTLTNGEWDIWGTVVWKSGGSGSTAVTGVGFGIGYVAGNNPPNAGPNVSGGGVIPTFTTTPETASYWFEQILPFRFNATPSTKTLYLKALAVYTVAPSIFGSFTARRVNI